MTIKKINFLYSFALLAAVLTACTINPTAADEAASKEVDQVPMATARSRTGSTVAADSKSLSGAKMPNSLLGVWHENSPEGKIQCERYRSLNADSRPVDESFDPLVGAVVITESVVHAYSEYGEGDFFAVKTVRLLSQGEWRVQSLVSIDTILSDDELGVESVDRFSLRNGLLLWTKDDKSEEERIKLAGFFRCGRVRK